MTSAGSRTAGGFPGLSLSVVVVAFGLRLWPGAVEELAYVPGTLARGEWWRLLGCHLAHWSFDHTLWDALTFLVVGGWCEAAGRGRMVAATLAGAVVIPPVVLAVQPELSAYAGLSGLDVALYALLVARVARERWRDGGAPLRAALVAASAGLVGKVACELATGGLWFVRSHGGDFVPVPLAHLIGGCIGGAVGSVGGKLASGPATWRARSLPVVDLGSPSRQGGVRLAGR